MPEGEPSAKADVQGEVEPVATPSRQLPRGLLPPVAQVVYLDAAGWEEVTAVLNDPPKPTAGLRKLAAATASDRLRRR